MLSNKNIELLVHRILSGRLIINQNQNILELRKPSLDLKLQADLLYKETYEANLYENFFLLEDLPNLLINLGLIFPSYKEDLKKLDKKLDTQKVNLYKGYSNQNERKKNKIKIDETKKYLNREYSNIHYLDYLSLEHYCEKAKNEFIIINTLYYFNTKNLVFDSHPIDYNIFNDIVTQISNYMISMETYKEIARHEYWKNLWNNNRYDILSDAVSEWSEEQKTLFNVATMYDKIYEHPESPSEEIISDDDALDGWMINQRLENNKQKAQKGVDNILPDKIRNSSEIFITPSSKEEIAEIQNLNSDEGKQRIRQKLNFIASNKDKVFEDAQLPDVKEKIRQDLYELQKRKG